MAHLKVSSRSNPNAVAGAFAGVVREQGRVEVQVVGAGALNQAIKAVAIARSMLAAQGIDLVCSPSFAEIEIDGQPRTAMQLVVERREPAGPATGSRTTGTRTTGTTKLPDGNEVPDLRIETTAGDLTVDSDAVAPLVTKPAL